MLGARGLTRRIRRLVLCVAAIGVMGATLRADGLGPGFQERTFHDNDGDHRYFVFVPLAYTPDQKWPMIVYLHGGAERGTDPRLPVIGGIGPEIKLRAQTFPFIVVFPQAEDRDRRVHDGWRLEHADAQRALKIVDQVEQDFSVDRGREVLTGTSMGGFGTWAVAAETASRWSAIVPISGVGDLSNAAKFAHTPVWAFHGGKDVLVLPSDHQKLIDAINAAGGRAYLTVVPGGRHNIICPVYDDDAVYEWMLNPKSEPRPESIIANVKLRQSSTAPARDFHLQFIPGVEIPQAILLQMDPEAISTVAATLPDLVPADVLSMRSGDVSTSKPGFLGLPFQITLSGIGYRGSLEQVIINPRDDGWISIAVGLRNIIGEVDSSQVKGRLVSATAGRMNILAGQYHTVWLKFDARPVIADRRLRFEIGAREFHIPSDDFYVTTPQVTGQGLPILRNTFSNSVSQNLVSGAYNRKSEIEQRVLDAIPTIVERIEQGLDSKLSQVRVSSLFPTPIYQPRYKLWPETVRVDHSGISMILGVVIAQPGVCAANRPVHVIEQPAIKLDDVPIRRGLTFGASAQLLEGLTASVVDQDQSEMHAHEVPLPEFQALEDATLVTKIVPDLARYGKELRVRTMVKTFTPVFLRQNGNCVLDTTAANKDRLFYDIDMPHLAMLIDIKTTPDQKEWQHCAQIDFSLHQTLGGRLKTPDFSQRVFDLRNSEEAKITTKGHFADGYQPIDPTLRANLGEDTLRSVWDAAGNSGFTSGFVLADHSIGTANLRLRDVTNVGHFITLRYLPATTRLTNSTSEAITYQIRSSHSEWSGPYTIKPKESHDFAVPYPLTLHSVEGSQELNQTLPMGTHFVFGKDDRPAPPAETAALGQKQTSAN
jgi:poly(3-hydroxybutyrate) depolymerase